MEKRVQRTYRFWSKADDKRLRELREKHQVEWADIAARLCRSISACQARYAFLCDGEPPVCFIGQAPIKTLPEIYEARLTPREREREAERAARLAALAERETELRQGSVTASFFGDPPRGYSALDGKTGMT